MPSGLQVSALGNTTVKETLTSTSYALYTEKQQHRDYRIELYNGLGWILKTIQFQMPAMSQVAMHYIWLPRAPALILTFQVSVLADAPGSKSWGSGTVWSWLGCGGEKHDPEAAQMQESPSAALASLYPEAPSHMPSNSMWILFHSLAGTFFWGPGRLGTQSQPPSPETPETPR